MALVVEDNELNRNTLCRRLKKRVFSVSSSANGQKAINFLATCKQKSFVILIDMRMPIIGLSANAIVGDRNRAIDVGCDSYETKPVNFDNLLKTLAQYNDDAA